MFDKKSYMREYMRTYYHEKKEKILIKRKEREDQKYFELVGHLEYIHNAIYRYAKQWHIPVDKIAEFRRWTRNDSEYDTLFKAWEESGFQKHLTPVAMRKIKKQGFVTANLYWSTKGQHSWWNGLLDDIKNLNKEMAKRQAKNNVATPEEQNAMKQRLAEVKK